MHFTKMQGLGNDYLYVYGSVPEDAASLSVRLSDRHFGAGSDGMIYIEPSLTADFRMRIFNADGSEAKMCGNGIRCVGKYVYDKGYTRKTELEIETLSGIRHLSLRLVSGKVQSVEVDMGATEVGSDRDFLWEGRRITGTPVSTGNPHLVLFTDNAENAPLVTLGPFLEHHAAFSDGVNVEFVQPLAPNRLRMRVWERGSGVTMACGTGACASVAAAIHKGFCPAGEPVRVILDGGELEILMDRNGIIHMTGPAEFIYEGEHAI
ncbi:MAG: diaminopimelate epimerase [Firmicutes bacterium]|nr:diaminopimelate epimerase [Bacillota bacterium]